MIEWSMNYITQSIIWAEGRKKSELPKYTTWSSSKDASFLGGFTVKTYSHNEFVAVTAHTSHGESYAKYFQIPLDKVEELCQALEEVRDFALSSQNNNKNK